MIICTPLKPLPANCVAVGEDVCGRAVAGVHASYGPSAHVLAYGHTVGGKRLEGSAYYHAGEPLPEKLVTRVTALHLN